MSNKSNKTYILDDEQGLDVQFYTGLDEWMLLRSGSTFGFIVENLDSFTEYASAISDSTQLLDEKYKDASLASLYFLEFQQFEAFFALFIAAFQDLPHWLYLTEYKTGELNEAVNAFVAKDTAKLTNGQFDNLEDAVAFSIYGNFGPDGEELAAKWRSCIDNICWYINRAAKKWCEDKGAYNAYKHGLRVSAGPARVVVSMSPQFSRPVQLLGGDTTITYLETERQQDGTLKVWQITRMFNPLESIRYLNILSKLVSNMKSTRLAELTNKEPTTFFSFVDDDLELTRQLSEPGRWSRTV